MRKNDRKYSNLEADLEEKERLKRKYAAKFRKLFKPTELSNQIELDEEGLRTLAASVIISKKLSQSKKIEPQLPTLFGKVPQDQLLTSVIFTDTKEAASAYRQIRGELEKIGFSNVEYVISSIVEYVISSIIAASYSFIYGGSALDAADKYFSKGVSDDDKMKYFWKTIPYIFAASSAVSNFYFARNNLAPSIRDLSQDFSKDKHLLNLGIFSLKTISVLLAAMATVGEAVFSATAIENILRDNGVSDNQETIDAAKLVGVIISFAVMTPITAKSMSSVSKRVYGYFKGGATIPKFDCSFLKDSAVMGTVVALTTGRLWGNYYVTLERLQQLSQRMSEDHPQIDHIMSVGTNPDPTSLVATATKGVLVAESAYNLGQFIISRFLSSAIPVNPQLKENNGENNRENQLASVSAKDYKKLDNWEMFIIGSGLLNGGSGGFMNVPQEAAWYAKLWYFVCATLMSLAVACKTNFEKYFNRVNIIESLLIMPKDDQEKLINFLESETKVKSANSQTIEDGSNRNASSSAFAPSIEMGALRTKSKESGSNSRSDSPNSSPRGLSGHKKASSSKGQIQNVE